jgi:ferredoxin-nitrate reductase
MEPRVDMNLGIVGEPDRWVPSACVLCSNGCGLDIAVKDGRIVGVRGRARHPVNFGHLGPKGENSWVANQSPRRGTHPMMRRRKQDPWQPVSWSEAMDFFIENFKKALSLGHENLACYNSGQLTLEEFYTLGKLWRGGLQSSNIDGNTRLCTATSATGLMANFGVDGPVASYVDIDECELLCIYGHNVAEAQTVLWERMLAAKKKNNGRIMVVDPRKSPTVRQGADLHLQVRLGTNVALMNGLIHLLIAKGWVHQEFVSAYTVGYEDLKTVVREYPPERVAEICGIHQDDLQRAAEWIGTTERFVSTVLQGFYQSGGHGLLVAGQHGTSPARRHRKTWRRSAVDGRPTLCHVKPGSWRRWLLSRVSQSIQSGPHETDRRCLEPGLRPVSSRSAQGHHHDA